MTITKVKRAPTTITPPLSAHQVMQFLQFLALFLLFQRTLASCDDIRDVFNYTTSAVDNAQKSTQLLLINRCEQYFFQSPTDFDHCSSESNALVEVQSALAKSLLKNLFRWLCPLKARVPTMCVENKSTLHKHLAQLRVQKKILTCIAEKFCALSKDRFICVTSVSTSFNLITIQGKAGLLSMYDMACHNSE